MSRGGSFECPNCGTEVARGRKACRQCGSDDLTGWQDSEEIEYRSLDIPDGYGPDDEPYRAGPMTPGSKTWSVIALVVVVAFVFWLLRLF